MLPNASPETGTYSVEVSGWDCDQIFILFVERTDLEWNECSGKHLVLRRSLLNKAVVFVRLQQPNGSNRSYAVAYEATFMQVPAGSGYSYHLSAVHPCRRDA
jgi:hypothetical protein